MVQYPDAWDQISEESDCCNKNAGTAGSTNKKRRFPCFVNEKNTQLFVANMTACARNCARGVN
jgi:hypothetical protein